MTARGLWLGWRRDVLRFVVLCCGALMLGLIINRARGAAKHELETIVPSGVGRLVADLDDDEDSLPAGRAAGETWTFRARIAPGQLVSIRNVRGPVTVESTSGESLSVSAVKTYGRSDPASVKVVTVAGSQGVTICALWDSVKGHCGSGDAYAEGQTHHSDVAVAFTVRVPRGVRIEATSVRGAVHVSGAGAPVIAGTVTGDVNAETSGGPVRAFTVNGSVRAAIDGFADSGVVKLTTVNGSVTVVLPARLDASISANALNGAIESDFPLSESQKVVVHHAEGTVGAGGRKIELNAVNGAIQIKKRV